MPWSVVSGTIIIHDNDCSTKYEIEGEEPVIVNNHDGLLTFFQSNLYHSIANNTTNYTRVVLAFDIYFSKNSIADVRLLQNIRTI
jgi:hypothetical protein